MGSDCLGLMDSVPYLPDRQVTFLYVSKFKLQYVCNGWYFKRGRGLHAVRERDLLASASLPEYCFPLHQSTPLALLLLSWGNLIFFLIKCF